MNKDEVPKKQKAKRKKKKEKTGEEKTYSNQCKKKKEQTPCFLGHLDPNIVFLITSSIYVILPLSLHF